MEKERLVALLKKQMFVDRVAYAICGQDRIPVEEIHYEVWEHPDGWYEEWLKIVYKGGAHAIRSVNATSELGIFEEIGKLAGGGYYSENFYYKELTESGTLTQIL